MACPRRSYSAAGGRPITPQSVVLRNHSSSGSGQFRASSAAASRRSWREGFSCWDQFVAMLFCQMGGANSPREICGGLATATGKLVHLGLHQAQLAPLGRREYPSALAALSDGVRGATEELPRSGCHKSAASASSIHFEVWILRSLSCALRCLIGRGFDVPRARSNCTANWITSLFTLLGLGNRR